MKEKVVSSDELTIPAFGYELLLNKVIPEILGRETAQMLYWAGRTIGKSTKHHSIEDIIKFFTKAGWGVLVLEKEKDEEYQFSLSSRVIEERIKANKDTTFQLEAGFLAGNIEQMLGFAAETHEDVKARKGKVILTVRWDKHDKVTL
jgi:predicted hydrocarbon binding protein